MDDNATMPTTIEMLAIGASAGGVEAISVLLEALPPDFSAPVAIVLHIPPNRASLLPEVFARHCALPVKEVEDKESMQAGVVYVAAPDYHMLVEPSRRFSLSCDEPINFSRPSIDLMFESAALAYRESLLAIVLTGASADGAAGLKTVRKMGGQAWVQDPGQARANTMPLAALEHSGADCVLSLEQMAGKLAALSSRTRSKRSI